MTATPWDPSTVRITLVNDDASLSELAAAIDAGVRFAVDTETHDATTFADGLWSAVRVISVAVADGDGEIRSFVIDVRDIPTARVAPVLARLDNVDGWNANFDQRVLRLAGCDVGSWRDAMFTDSVLHSGLSGFEFYHGLAHAAKKFIGVDVTGKGATQTSYDAATDLSDEQVRYAALDAAVTMKLAQHLDSLVAEQGLTIPVTLEHTARPFILAMMERGMPFDYEGWTNDVLATHRDGHSSALAQLAALTDGGESTLFGEATVPGWNPDSDAPTRNALNTYARDAVHAFTGGRDLAKTDKLDKTTLKQINHPLTKALLKYRDHAKVLSTYGENLEEYIQADGRIRPQYKQGGVVATGRLSSDKPNAQNFAPAMKPYFRPRPRIDDTGREIPRCFVYADLSQAELRVLAQVSAEERMRDLFRLGGDFHARTAADMFRVDMDTLKDSDPNEHSNNRKKAKGVNFGIPYGLGAAALATSLTVNSKLHTSTDEAAAMLKAYNAAYPNVANWLSIRDRFVKDTAAQPGPIDWNRSLELHELWAEAESERRKFKRANKRNPSGRELSELVEPEATLTARLTEALGSAPTPAQIDTERARKADRYDWAFSFDRPVVLRPDGSVWTFESRTLTGRRRVFSVAMDSSPKDKFEGILTSSVLTICTSDKPDVAALRAEFAATHQLSLPVGVNRYDRSSRTAATEARKRERMAVVKEFEGSNKPLKYELVKFVRSRMGDQAVVGFLFPMALQDQVRSKGNQFRNHPIQSLVADIGLEYYTVLDKELRRFSDAFPVQAVHDSIAIECDLAQAPEIRAVVKAALENALAHWCPDVPAKADADIRLSLSDDDVIDDADVPAKLEELTASRM